MHDENILAAEWIKVILTLLFIAAATIGLIIGGILALKEMT